MVNSTIKPTIVHRGPSRNVRQPAPSEVQFLARELHDRVIQEVWCLDLELSDLRAKVEAGSPDAVARLDAVRGRISTVYDELRLALSELRNDTPIDRPFDDAVQSLLLDFSRKTNIDADYSPGCPGVLFAKTTQLQLIAILRHAVANVHQHAHATHITVKRKQVARTGASVLPTMELVLTSENSVASGHQDTRVSALWKIGQSQLGQA